MQKSRTSLIPIGSTIGILGGGQLGRMAAIAAAQLGYRVHIFSPEPDSPAAEVSRWNTCAGFDDQVALKKFADSVDVVTCEMEHVPVDTLKFVSKFRPLYPRAGIFKICQDRVFEKSFLNELGIATTRWQTIESSRQIREAYENGWTAGILKTALEGYDGKGQVRLGKNSFNQDPENIWEQLFGSKEGAGKAILEEIVSFECELSVVVVRDKSGEIVTFDPVENIHCDHILAVTYAPASLNGEILTLAKEIASKIAFELDLCGVLAVEMFLTTSGQILVNELAPRPHNSGHWAIDACSTDQFEQLIRAICGLPLRQPIRWAEAEMINLIGDDIEKAPEYLSMPDARLHLYGKQDVRTGRKMGHVTIVKLLSKK